jgi:hypothetical protein
MQQQVYYLVHKETGMKLKYYKTLSGARIAQRQRNHRLGFITRIDRVPLYIQELELELEAELCLTTDDDNTDNHSIATYCILEDYIETLDILD